MYFHLRDHIYIAQFKEELLILDTKKDKYIICFKDLADLLLRIFIQNNNQLVDHSFSILQFTEQDQENIKKLIAQKIIVQKDIPYNFYIDQKKHSHGVSNIDWNLSLEDKNQNSNMDVFRAFLTMFKVKFYMKNIDFYSTIKFIKNSRKDNISYIIPNQDDLDKLAHAVNKAGLIFPTSTKSLEWAMTFVLLALKKKWKCNFEIGVQNYPFFAQAWVECNGRVVFGSQEAKEKLAIILNEPFRRVNT